MPEYPSVWLRSFFGFAPEEDGYIGWSQEGHRRHVMGKVAPGDLMLIYGATSGSTASKERLQVLGLLQIDPVPIRDAENHRRRASN